MTSACLVALDKSLCAVRTFSRDFERAADYDEYFPNEHKQNAWVYATKPTAALEILPNEVVAFSRAKNGVVSISFRGMMTHFPNLEEKKHRHHIRIAASEDVLGDRFPVLLTGMDNGVVDADESVGVYNRREGSVQQEGTRLYFEQGNYDLVGSFKRSSPGAYNDSSCIVVGEGANLRVKGDIHGGLKINVGGNALVKGSVYGRVILESNTACDVSGDITGGLYALTGSKATIDGMIQGRVDMEDGSVVAANGGVSGVLNNNNGELILPKGVSRTRQETTISL